MKKLALLLALALALSCCLLMLASCSEDGNDTSSAAGTSSAAAASSEEATSSKEASSTAAASSEEATSSEEPEESSEEPEESSEPETSEEEPSTGGTVESTEMVGTPSGDNLALGAAVISGADLNTVASQYNADLTDGKAHDVITYDGEWFAYWYNGNDADVESKTNSPGGVARPTIDLGEAKSITAARINVFQGNNSGIQGPKEITFEFSADGENWTAFGTKTLEVPTDADSTVGWIGFEMSESVEARYVRVSLVSTGVCWTFINEIEVY